MCQDENIRAVFSSWCNEKYNSIKQADLHFIVSSWAISNDDEHYDIPYQRLLAMMRTVDRRRSGRIEMDEFIRYAKEVTREMNAEGGYYGAFDDTAQSTPTLTIDRLQNRRPSANSSPGRVTSLRKLNQNRMVV